MKQLIDDLKETRRQLEIRGRCIGALVNKAGKVCLDGAIVAAVTGEVGDIQQFYDALYIDPRVQAVTRALNHQIPDDHPAFGNAPKSRFSNLVAVFYFNDDLNTTDEDCLTLIDKALAEAGGL